MNGIVRYLYHLRDEMRPRPTNERLKRLLADVDSVTIKKGGVYSKAASGSEVILKIADKEKVQQFKDLFEIINPTVVSYCMCSGNYAIELFSSNKLKATFGWHHEESIRYYKWKGDAELKNKRALLEFMSELGLTKPLEDSIETERLAIMYEDEFQYWLQHSPKCFRDYMDRSNFGFNAPIPQILETLRNEIPFEHEQILALLTSYGNSSIIWTGYAAYQDLARELLLHYSTLQIVTAYKNSSKEILVKRGLGRYLCDFNFKKQRANELAFIPIDLIEELKTYFESVEDEHGIYETELLKKQKQESALP